MTHTSVRLSCCKLAGALAMALALLPAALILIPVDTAAAAQAMGLAILPATIVHVSA